MNEPLLPPENQLVDTLPLTVRGPRRNGIYALWLVVRACEGLLPPDVVSPRGHRHRLDLLERRLTSLSLPLQLRRALLRSIRDLQDGTPEVAASALRSLVAPVRESLGSETGDGVATAARTMQASSNRAHGKST